MVDLSALNLSDEPVFEPSHEFEIDIACVVVVNRRLALEGIARSRIEQLSKDDDLEERNYTETFYDDLVVQANRLAIVGLVTRFRHWISRLAKRHKVSTKNQLEELNKLCGEGPIPTAYFTDLVQVRNSIIHADSKAQWDFHGPQVIADRYRNAFDEVEISEEQFQEAVDKTVQQIKWYDERPNIKP